MNQHPNPANQPPQLQFRVAAHPNDPAVAVLAFTHGPITSQILWPVAELGNVIQALGTLVKDAPRIAVPRVILG